MTGNTVAFTRLSLWALTVAAFAVTRLPATGPDAALIFAIGAFATLVLASLSTLWPKAPASLRGWAFLASLVLILVPTSASAITPLPPWAVALLYVVTLHVYFRDDATRAPRLGAREGTRSGGQLLRFIPAATALAALVAAPLAMQILPWRIRAVFELQTAFEPVLPLMLLGGALVVGGLLRGVTDRRSGKGEKNAAKSPDPSGTGSTEVDAT